jgi:sulfur carrier protein
MLVQIVVNGESRSVYPGLTVASLLQELNLDPARVAVELNRRMVRKTEWDATPVEAGAKLEVVQFVGGG